MRLHVTHDDKFVDYFIANSHSFGYEDNNYVIYNDKVELKYTRSNNVKVALPYSKEFYQYVGDIKNYDAVYIHFFSTTLVDFVLSIPANIPVIWVFWGGDGFVNSIIQKYFLKPLTLEFFTNDCKKKGGRFDWKNIILKLISSDNRKWVKALRRFNYFCHYIEEDYHFLRKEFNLKAMFIDFNYGGWYQFTDISNISKTIKGNNICIGNSGDMTNNHLDVLECLKGKLSPEQKIYAPLSYAIPSREYLEVVIQKGQNFFGEEFVPLTEFLSKSEYDRIMGTCQYFVMPHLRSQAFGNILFALAMGKKIFMYSESSLYKLLVNQGFKIFNIENDLNQVRALIKPICQSDIKLNFDLLETHYGYRKMMARYKTIMMLN